MSEAVPTVSVIIPTYNRTRYLREAIQSVLDQTFTHYEIIVVDDGSPTGAARAIVDSYEDERISYVYQDNAGLGAARNTGVRHAKGDLIAMLDDDDTFFPDKLEHQVQAVKDQPPEVAFVAGGYLLVDAEGRSLGEKRPWEITPDLNTLTWLTGCPVIVNSILVRKSWFLSCGGHDASMKRLEDWDLWLRMSAAGAKMIWQERVVCTYRIHGTNMMHDIPGVRQSAIRMLDQFFTNPTLPASVIAEKDRIYARAYIQAAAREYGAGNYSQAQGELQKAIELDPNLDDEKNPEALDWLLGWVLNPLIGDPFVYMKSVLEHLPPTAAGLTRQRRRAYARGAMGLFFNAYRVKNWRVIRQALGLALKNDPSWFANRGVISISLRAWVPFLRERWS